MSNHLAPNNCFICGCAEEQHTSKTHTFWSNADAKKDFANEPQVDYNVEATYVAQHRPY